MGAGRKTQTFTLDVRTQYSPSHASSSTSMVNGSVSARNLRKSDLGGVIFGCRHSTMKECLSNQIFGLPSLHFSYIKNVEPGLPLFLFNYSDRKLYGIFEAASHGQMNINPYGWSADGSEKTQYPAQVRVRVRMQCHPLMEDTYKKIINDNYYSASHFWFELDHAQTGGIISLFESSPFSSSTLGFIRNAPNRRTIQAVPIRNTRCEDAASQALTPSVLADPNHSNGESQFPVGSAKIASTWNFPFKVNPDSYARIEDQGFKGSVSESKCNIPFKVNSDSYARTEDQGLMGSVLEADSAHLDQFNFEAGPSVNTPCLDGENQTLETLPNEERRVENKEELIYRKLKKLALDRGHSNSSLEGLVEDNEFPCVMNDMPFEDECSPMEPIVLEEKYEEANTNSSDHHSTIDQLRQEVGELKAFSMEQSRKICSLEKKLADSDTKLHQLKCRVKLLESQLGLSTACVDEPLSNFSDTEPHESFDELSLGAELLFIVGGYDSKSWLSTLECYSPITDVMKSLMPMSSVRANSSAVTLHGKVYVFGGGNDNSWYDTVEAYNPLSNEWTSCPRLNERKGCLASATLDNKIFAMGGGNGVESFSDVEMFDPALGRWIRIQSMLQKRFATAAVELNGVLYVTGGFDGNDYLKSAERFDRREASWSKLPSMNSSRGCHSLAILNHNIYALGGYDGTKMVPSVEVFDHRMGSWMAGDEMNHSRGYSVSAVIGKTIYIIGGLKEDNNIANTVECYKEGHGWSVTNLKGIGKRCFFSATLL